MRPSRPKKRACEDAVWAVGHGGGVRPTPSTRRYNYNVEDLAEDVGPRDRRVPVWKSVSGGRAAPHAIDNLDVVLTLINLWAGGFWFLVCLIGAICGFIGAHIYNSCLVLVYVVFAWVWVAGLILNIIVVTIFFFANRHEFSWVEGSFTAWYIAFMVWSLILLVVRVYIAGFVHKFFNALQSVGDDRAKELGEHSNYDQKCVVVP